MHGINQIKSSAAIERSIKGFSWQIWRFPFSNNKPPYIETVYYIKKYNLLDSSSTKVQMSEVKSYLQKLKRSSIFKRSSLKDKRRENWEQRIEKSLGECDDIKNLLTGRPATPDLERTNNGTLLSKRSRAFVTEPLSNEELDKIKYINFAMERDYRAGTRPVIPRMESTNRRKLSENLTPTSILAADFENNAIVKDFSEFVEISFNSLSISDEYTPQPSFSKQPDEPRTASSKSLESLWSKNVK